MQHSSKIVTVFKKLDFVAINLNFIYCEYIPIKHSAIINQQPMYCKTSCYTLILKCHVQLDKILGECLQISAALNRHFLIVYEEFER